MKERLIHILDQSVCLSRKQMKEYLSGTMLPEEAHAAEIHLNACPLCSMAMEGFEAHSEEALEAIASLNSGFLKEHFDNIAPQIHLNSIAPAAALPASQISRRRGNIQPLRRMAPVAAAVLLALGVLWFVEFGRDRNLPSAPIALADRSQTAQGAGLARAGNDRVYKTTTISPASAGTAAAEERKPVEASATAARNKQAVRPGPSAPASSEAKGMNAMANVSQDVSADEPAAATNAVPVRAISGGYGPPDLQKKKEPVTKETLAYARHDQTANGNAFTLSNKPALKYATAPAATKSKQLVTTETADNAEKSSAMELGDESFDKGKYSAALAHYKQQMSQGDARARYRATIKAARCYASLGNKTKAMQLLQSVVDEGAGPERRSARRLLRTLQ